MKITIERALDPAHVERVYGFYRAAFEPLVARAAAKHVLSPGEFAGEMADARIDKYVAWDADGRPGTLACLTTDLTAVPWIEPGYYAARYPEHVAQGRLYYLGYLVADPAGQIRAGSVITEMIIERCTTERAVLAWDVCAYNARRGMGIRAARLPRTHGVAPEVLDTQTYYSVVFGA
jgi:hypothetical protein